MMGSILPWPLLRPPSMMRRCAFALAVTVLASVASTTISEAHQQELCTAPLLTAPGYDASIHSGINNASNVTAPKLTYRVGVLAIRGFPSAYAEFNDTFSTYLTASAGRQFDPPLTFRLKPLDFDLLFTDVASRNVDFIYVNPSAYSCIETEYGASSLVSQVSRRNVGGNRYDLTQFGGVVVTRSDRTDINTITDLRDKIIAAASISGLGSGQMQFRLMQQAGMSYINDPKQLVFTSNQGKVVNGVLHGEFDVGLVRTDQIERTKDRETGQLVDKTQLKIIDVQTELNIDGVPFPFESSTILYPEWNIAALGHVPNVVSVEVQRSMLELADHASIGYELLDCYDHRNCTADATIGNVTNGTAETVCMESCHNDILYHSDDDACHSTTTTPTLALHAASAQTSGRYAGWRSTLSYMELRNMQEETGFVSRDPDLGYNRCVRASKLYDAIVCPAGHFRKSEADVDRGCNDIGLVCEGGFKCLCKPCVKAFDVDVFSVSHDDDEDGDGGGGEVGGSSNGVGCPKMALCGTAQQRQTITFRAVDNRERPGLILSVRVLAGGGNEASDEEIRARPLVAPEEEGTTTANTTNITNTYEFSLSAQQVGIVILEIFADGEQINESPLRLLITERDCSSDYNDELRVATDDGQCSCKDNSVEISGKCVSYAVLLPSILVPLVAVAMIAVYVYVERKKKQADSVWSVKPNELHFDDPPEIIGRGTFGLVLLAEYRGTQVAVKRVIPPRAVKKGSGSGGISRRNSLLGSGSATMKERESLKRRESFNFKSGQDGQLRSTVTSVTLGDDDNAAANDDAAELMESGTVPRRAVAFQDQRRHPPHPPSTGDDDDDDSALRSPTTIDANAFKSGSGSLKLSKSNNNGSLSASRKASASNDSNRAVLTRSGPLTRSGSVSSILGTTTTNGSHSFGRRRLTGLYKHLRQQDEYSKLKADFIVEMRHLSKLRHPCITTVMGAVIEKNEEPMLIMEYMDHGSLYDMLHNTSFPIDGDLLLPILRDIAQGVRFLHAATPKVIHGDLKAANVLVDGKFRAKVADFGLSQKKSVGATGTPLWMAPELLRGESDNTPASDVYSFGIILYEVYSRRDPYEGENLRKVLFEIVDPEINKRPPIPEACPSQVKSIMTDCLLGKPEERPTFEELDLRLKRLDAENVEPGEMHLSHQMRKMRKEKRNTDLLHRVFPPHIAEALRDGRKPEAESHDCVTIFFSDIVGFTDISAALSPEKVSDMLDRLYLSFDDISHKHDVFKIETIGDAYMAVTNLVKDQSDDHVKRMAEFSVDVIAAAAKTPVDLDDLGMGFVRIRVGFHSGPCVANVVGSRLPKYSLFGDTVNTAARMESNSLPGRIQCTERSADLLRSQSPTMPIAARGNITVKGKGDMFTYWVNDGDIERSKSKASGECEADVPVFESHPLGVISEEAASRRSSTLSRRSSMDS